MKLKVGDPYPTWFSDHSHGHSTILAIEPYWGQYSQWFSHVLRVTAPRTSRGWMELPVDLR